MTKIAQRIKAMRLCRVDLVGVSALSGIAFLAIRWVHLLIEIIMTQSP